MRKLVPLPLVIALTAVLASPAHAVTTEESFCSRSALLVGGNDLTCSIVVTPPSGALVVGQAFASTGAGLVSGEVDLANSFSRILYRSNCGPAVNFCAATADVSASLGVRLVTCRARTSVGFGLNVPSVGAVDVSLTCRARVIS